MAKKTKKTEQQERIENAATHQYLLNIQQAISDIVTLQTLPPQIDYARPFEVKAAAAEKFLETLSAAEKADAYEKINSQVESYHTPFKAADGNYYSVAALDAMF